MAIPILSLDMTVGDITCIENPLGSYEPTEILNGVQKNLTGKEKTWLYFTVNADTILNFPDPTPNPNPALNNDCKFYFIVNFGNRRIRVYNNGVDTGIWIRRNRVYIAHIANGDLNLIRIR